MRVMFGDDRRAPNPPAVCRLRGTGCGAGIFGGGYAGEVRPMSLHTSRGWRVVARFDGSTEDGFDLVRMADTLAEADKVIRELSGRVIRTGYYLTESRRVIWAQVQRQNGGGEWLPVGQAVIA